MHRRTLWTLYAVNFLNAIGMWFFLPLLPIFLGRRGGSAALVGATVAAGLLSNAAIRYPAGWAADRFGTRPVMLAAMAFTAALFLAYLLPLPAPAFILVRFIQRDKRADRSVVTDTRVGDCRQDSISENRDPAGTVSDARSRSGSIGSTASAAQVSKPWIRSAAPLRIRPIRRVSTVIPGNSTRLRRNHPTAWSNMAPGPSAYAQARASRNL
jgi:hypothetical protein